MKRIIQFVIFTMIVSLMFGLTAAATDLTTEAVSETFTDDGEAVAEKVKAVMIILAEAETREEAIERVMELEPEASAADAVDLVDSFVEMIEYVDCRECMMDFLGDGLEYGIEEEWAVWYVDTYFPELPDTCGWYEEEVDTVAPDEIDDMIESVVAGVKDGALSMKDAILMVSEIAGMSKAKAEDLINKAISVGDSYLQDTGWWEGAKEKVMENLGFFTVCLIAFVDVLAIIVLVIKIKRSINNIDYGTAQVAKDSTDNKNAISQTLENLSETVTAALQSGDLTRVALIERDAQHTELEERLMQSLAKDAEMKRIILNTQSFILQSLKLIYSRTDLTLADKSVLDLWSATAEVLIEEGLGEEDKAKLADVNKILKGDANNA